jgi:ERCC4-type nuclease
MTDSSCIPIQNRQFFFKTKHDNQIKNIYLDLSITQMRLDRNRLTSFYITKCLTNIEDIAYLRYNPNVNNFTKAFTLIKCDDSMNITTTNDKQKSSERILFIKRASKNAINNVRLGIIINKKRFWFTTNNNNSWTQNIKQSNLFKIEYV